VQGGRVEHFGCGVVTRPVAISQSHVNIPAGDGLGIEVDGDKVDRYRIADGSERELGRNDHHVNFTAASLSIPRAPRPRDR
jgi:hypothetical protein